ncbi:neuronal acetylcholine receptor subunit beta-3-like [Convolutriloba macropyga]|uniref:neuronal acetylcholine receptor subunit beta-3-like n=1 Tax=Convolutriloba macropyga TaxID=536237 RepID=UPI003F528D03
MFQLFCALVYLNLQVFNTINAGNGNEETYNLIDKLKSNFNRFSPPQDLFNQTVQIYLELYKVLDIDEKQGLINLKLILIVTYGSNIAAWNPEEHGGIGTLTLPEHIFWNPPLILRDAVERSYEAFTDQMVLHDGIIISKMSFFTVKLACNIDATNFPFDTQTCPIVMYPPGGYHNVFNADFWRPELNLEFYEENEQWELLKPVTSLKQTFFTEGNPFEERIKMVDHLLHVLPFAARPCGILTVDISWWEKFERSVDQKKVWREKHFLFWKGLSVNLRLKRRHLFYAVFIVCPNVILYVLSGLTFLLPTDSGEKVSFSVTLLLAQVVSFGTLTSVFPASSLNFPLLAYFVLAVTLHMSFLCFCAVIVVSIHINCSQLEMPSRIQSLISSKLLFFLCLKPHASQVSSSQKHLWAHKTCQTSDREMSVGNDVPAGREQTNATLNHEEKLAERWRSLSSVMDRTVLIVHVVVFLAVLCLFYEQIKE